jgi:subtilisin family serine protease
MRRSWLVALAALLVLAAGVGIAVARHDNGRHTAKPPAPTPSATSATPSTPAASTEPPIPTPTGSGPRDDEYDVVYAAGVARADAQEAVAKAGGQIVHENTDVGVASVMAGPDFLTSIRKDKRIYGAVANPANGEPVAPEPNPQPPQGSGPVRTNPASNGNDPLADLQWDMAQIHAPDARKTQKGDARVLVAVIDTGVDRTHPDLVKAYDRTLSRNFVTDYPGADGACEAKDCHDPVGTDDNGHGTHVAGTIAAASDGFGMAGVAAGVRLVDLRAGQDSGLFLLMPTVDALTYAGDIGVDVANLSYFVDPWLYNCPNGADDSAEERYEQRALIEGSRRAVDYAYGHGVTLVAAAGNEHDDLAHHTVDTISPDFPDGAAKRRRIDASCLVLPTELPHVVQVSATGRDKVKADYSDYGLGHIAVAAPGGSSLLADGSGPAASNQTLSAYPADLAREDRTVDASGRPRTPGVVEYCAGTSCAYYQYLSGTSMASPHAAGVAALIVSRYGTADPAHPGKLTMRPDDVIKRLKDSATARACPSPPRQTYPRRPATYAATCTGSTERNSFYGDGIVDALAAVNRR